MRDLDAIRRLLVGGHAGGQAKLDVMQALASRKLLIATWEPLNDGFRTVINTTEEEALPIFTNEREMREAAARFGLARPSRKS